MNVSIGDNLNPISVNFTLKDHTFEVLKEAILGMNIYHPDADLRLDERQLADRLAVSRTPIREALARGLALEKETGTNPYEFGLIGSSDTHVAAGGFDENVY